MLQLFKNCGNYLKISAILLCVLLYFKKLLLQFLNSCRNYKIKNSSLHESRIIIIEFK